MSAQQNTSDRIPVTSSSSSSTLSSSFASFPSSSTDDPQRPLHIRHRRVCSDLDAAQASSRRSTKAHTTALASAPTFAAAGIDYFALASQSTFRKRAFQGRRLHYGEIGNTGSGHSANDNDNMTPEYPLPSTTWSDRTDSPDELVNPKSISFGPGTSASLATIAAAAAAAGKHTTPLSYMPDRRVSEPESIASDISSTSYGTIPAVVNLDYYGDDDDVPPVHLGSGSGSGSSSKMRSMRFDTSSLFVDLSSTPVSTSSAAIPASVDPLTMTGATSSAASATLTSTFHRPGEDDPTPSLGFAQGRTYSLDSPAVSPKLRPTLPGILRRASFQDHLAKLESVPFPPMLSIFTSITTSPRHPRSFLIDTPTMSAPPSPSMNKRSKSPPPFGSSSSSSASARTTAAQREALLTADDIYLTRKTRRAIGLATTLAFWFAVLMFASALFGIGAHNSLAAALPDAQGTGLPTQFGATTANIPKAGSAAAAVQDDVQLMAEKLFAGYGGIRYRHGPGKVLGAEKGYKARAMLKADDAVERLSAGAVTKPVSDAEKLKRRSAKNSPGGRIRDMWASYFGPMERAWEEERARRVASQL